MDYALAYHCSPAIAGVKPANLISLRKPQAGAWSSGVGGYAPEFHRRGVYLYKLADCPERSLMLVYNKTLLSAYLGREEIRDFLGRYGYGSDRTLTAMLRRLAGRIRSCEAGDYPHEIGVFLGYPLDDVEGFIHHRGNAYMLCGYWKVYHNPARAKQLFHAYDRVRRFYCDRVSAGEKIHTIQFGGIAYEQGIGHLLVGNG